MTVHHLNTDEMIGEDAIDGTLILLSRMLYNRVQGYYARPGGAVFDGDNTAGLTATIVGTAATADDSLGPFVRCTTSTTINTDAGIITTGIGTRGSWSTEARCQVKLGATITSARYWVGMQSATPMASSDPAIHAAMFRYDTGVDTGGYWATYTNDGTGAGTATQLNSGIQGGIGQAVASRTYDLRVKIEALQGAAPNKVMFYIDDLLVATHIANLPGAGATPSDATTTLKPVFAVRCLLGSAARAIDVNQFVFLSQPIY